VEKIKRRTWHVIDDSEYCVQPYLVGDESQMMSNSGDNFIVKRCYKSFPEIEQPQYLHTVMNAYTKDK